MTSTNYFEDPSVPGAGDLDGHAYGQLHKSGMVPCEEGYTEALEHRLEVTENALLRIMSVIEPRALQTAFLSNAATAIKEVSQFRSSEDKSALMAHWEEFALETPDDILRWSRAIHDGRENASSDVVEGTDEEAAPDSIAQPYGYPEYLSQGVTGSQLGMMLGNRYRNNRHPPASDVSGIVAPSLSSEIEKDSSGSQCIGQKSNNRRPSISNTEQISTVSQDFRQQYLW
ncbi:hypothetical protein G7054_g50 [Neopestalotiopsis clavispora]|nr:hypothetical protein G7054_g50 [Neopestalotiopsis clavispora]